MWLAKKLGMSQSGINDIANGKVVRPKQLREMASILQTSQEYLLCETDDPKPPLSEELILQLSELSLQNRDVVQHFAAQLGAAERAAGQTPSPRPRGSNKPPRKP